MQDTQTHSYAELPVHGVYLRPAPTSGHFHSETPATQGDRHRSLAVHMCLHWHREESIQLYEKHFSS